MKLTEVIALALSWAILGGLVVAFFFYAKKHQELPEDWFGDPHNPILDGIPQKSAKGWERLCGGGPGDEPYLESWEDLGLCWKIDEYGIPRQGWLTRFRIKLRSGVLEALDSWVRIPEDAGDQDLVLYRFVSDRDTLKRALDEDREPPVSAKDVLERLLRVARFVGDEKKAPEDTEAIRLMKKWAQQDFNGGLPCGSAPCEGCPLTGDCGGKSCAEVVAWARTELTKLGIDWRQG